MLPCPTCGSSEVPCPCEEEARIAAWIEAASTGHAPIEGASTGVPPGGPASDCTACGYSSEMTNEGQGTHCPACGVVLLNRRADLTPRVTQLVDCPECGRRVGVTAEEEGKTVLCPGCSYFLGTPIAKPGAGRSR